MDKTKARNKASDALSATDIVRREAVSFTHSEIHRKYRLDFIEKVPVVSSNGMLKGVVQEDIDKLEAMFLTAFYPSFEARRERDRSFESLVRLLKNPSKLYRVIPSMPVIALRYATVFPYALRIGLNSIIAFNRSINIENKLVANLVAVLQRDRVAVTDSLVLKPEHYFEAYRQVPYVDGRKMISIAFWLVDNGKKQFILDAAKGILNDVSTALKRSDEAAPTPIYTDDIAAIAYGRRTLDTIADTLGSFSDSKLEKVSKLVRTVENYYLDLNYGKIH